MRTRRAPQPLLRITDWQSDGNRHAAQISRIRPSPNLPRRWVSVPTETLSTESRFTADSRGIGSSPGSSITSLARPRIVVVHGAIECPPKSGNCGVPRRESRRADREIFGSSHHHTSPLAGRSVTRRPPPHETTPSRPIRPPRRVDVRRKRRTRRRSELRDVGSPAHREPDPTRPRRLDPTSGSSGSPRATRQQLVLTRMRVMP